MSLKAFVKINENPKCVFRIDYKNEVIVFDEGMIPNCISHWHIGARYLKDFIDDLFNLPFAKIQKVIVEQWKFNNENSEWEFDETKTYFK